MNRLGYWISFALLLWIGGAAGAAAPGCVDPLDTYERYDDHRPDHERPNRTVSDYYVLSYSWAPGYCEGRDETFRKPGGKDYLQCGSGRKFGYILHGLWPQGRADGKGGRPRWCEYSDPEKIPRTVLNEYLCMTPSVDLLQHEYEKHGTCMPDEALATPRGYFSTALRLHRRMTLPEEEMRDPARGLRWFTENNRHLEAGAIYYHAKSREWRFCFGLDFESMGCPDK